MMKGRKVITNARFLVLLGVCFLFVSPAAGQEREAGASPSIALNSNVANLLRRSNMKLEAQFMEELDTKKSKAGDAIVLKTTKAYKLDGLMLVEKGARVTGRVIEVQAKSKTSGSSMVAFVIDSIEQKSGSMAINARLTGMQAPTTLGFPETGVSGEGAVAGGSSSVAQPAFACDCHGSKSGEGGGAPERRSNSNYLGENGKDSDVFPSGTLRGLRVSQPSDPAEQGIVTLSMPGKNLRIEKGTMFSLNVSEMPGVGGN